MADTKYVRVTPYWMASSVRESGARASKAMNTMLKWRKQKRSELRCLKLVSSGSEKTTLA
jgi:hypothetical protein